MLGHFKHEGIGFRWRLDSDPDEQTWVVKTYIGVYEVAERCPDRPNLTTAVEVAKGLAPALLDIVRGNAA